MNYKAHYQRLMDRSKGRILTGYSERHHIIPRCLGGDNSRENIAVLTAEEHYVAHLLLVKMYPGHRGLLFAAIGMASGTKKHERSNNKMYGWIRKRWSESLRGRVVSAETRAKLSAQKIGNKNGLGTVHSAETKLQMSLASKGRKKSSAHCAAISKVKRGCTHAPPTEETRRKISISNIEASKHKDFSFMQSPEYKEGQAEKMRRVWVNRRLGLAPMPRTVSIGE